MKTEHMTKETEEIVFQMANKELLPQMMLCIQEAQARLAAADIGQWQDGYPNSEQLLKDITRKESYVILYKNKVIATFCASFSEDPNYKVIDGAWHYDAPYVVLHRIAVRNSHLRQGLAAQIFQYTMQVASNKGISLFRVDTHADNQAMQSLLNRFGFRYCGIIQVRDGARYAYDLKW
ncbi:MAG TPA: GNAT family N-acetyltransferase [Bacteroidaceae bacterium]|nr:GNAT family N-acetyltransferase [Bacteroidaceae bacterium]